MEHRNQHNQGKALTKEVTEAVGKLSAQYFAFLKEDEEVRKMRQTIAKTLERAIGYFPIATRIEQAAKISFDGNSKRIKYCTRFMVKYDWLQYAVERCEYLISVRADLEREV